MIRIDKEDLNNYNTSFFLNPKHIVWIRSQKEYRSDGSDFIALYISTASGEELLKLSLKSGRGWEENGLKFNSILAQIDKVNGELDD